MEVYHFESSLASKANKQALAGLTCMPNLGGSRTSMRRMYMHPVLLGLLYGISIWERKTCSSLRIKTTLYRIQQRLAQRIIHAYRTVSFAAASPILAEISSAELLAKSRTCTVGLSPTYGGVPWLLESWNLNARRPNYESLNSGKLCLRTCTASDRLGRPCLNKWIGPGERYLSKRRIFTGHRFR